jgi:hypothetical protein
MSDLDRIVDVQISKQTAVPSVESFQDILIVAEFLKASTTPVFATDERVRSYATIDEVLAGGFADTTFVYKAAAAAFMQNPRPAKVYVGRKETGSDGTETWTEALAAIKDLNNKWYGLIVSTRLQAEQELVADWVETNKKLCVLASADTAIISGTGDIAEYLDDNSYERTAVLYHPSAATTCPDAAWMGKMFPKNPGSVNWAHKTLAGVTAYALTGAQITAIKSKNGNYYTEVSGNSITQFGTVGSGEYIDVTHGLDWLIAQIQADVYTPILQQDKVPYSNEGAVSLEAQLKYALQKGVNNTIIQAGFNTSVPLVETVAVQDRAGRMLPDIKFDAVLAGAINKVRIRGVVTL